MELLTNTSFEIGSNDGLDAIEQFLMAIGGQITTRKQHSINVRIEHPDGFDVYVKITRYEFEKDYIEVRRRCGDDVLFKLIYEMLIKYDFGRGEDPQLYLGQLCPKLEPKGPYQSPNDVPLLILDANLKRKRN